MTLEREVVLEGSCPVQDLKDKLTNLINPSCVIFIVSVIVSFASSVAIFSFSCYLRVL